jgi:hypothetical protein
MPTIGMPPIIGMPDAPGIDPIGIAGVVGAGVVAVVGGVVPGTWANAPAAARTRINASEMQVFQPSMGIPFRSEIPISPGIGPFLDPGQ